MVCRRLSTAPLPTARRAQLRRRSSTATTLTGTDGETVVLEGNASAVRADQRMNAERIEYDVAADRALATGSVRYEDATNAFYATQARAELAENRTELTDVRYALKARRGQGRASKVTTEGGKQTSMDAVTYTACPGEDPSWQIEASNLTIDHEAGRATAEDFKLRVGGVPLVYWPHASFPIDDQRKSGFLAPKFGIGSDGFDFAAPYYWNIAPNYDATLIPRLITDRGIQTGGEFRYLYDGSSGQLDGEWLPDDDILGRDRERLRWRHYGSLLPSVRFDADINHVSDDRYFVDLGDSLNTTSISVLTSMAQLSGGSRNWRWSVLADKYELILPDQEERTQLDPYQRLPRMHLAYDAATARLALRCRCPVGRFPSRSLLRQHRRQTAIASTFRLPRVSASILRRLSATLMEPNPGASCARARSLRHTSYDLDRNLPANAICAAWQLCLNNARPHYADFQHRCRIAVRARRTLRPSRLAADTGTPRVLPVRPRAPAIRTAGIRHCGTRLQLRPAIPREPLHRRRSPGGCQSTDAGGQFALAGRRWWRAGGDQRRSDLLFRSAPERIFAG